MKYTQHLVFIALLAPTAAVLGAAIISLAAAEAPAPISLSQDPAPAYGGCLEQQP